MDYFLKTETKSRPETKKKTTENRYNESHPPGTNYGIKIPLEPANFHKRCFDMVMCLLHSQPTI